MPKRWTQRPNGSTWGDFGADDQRGRLNLLTAWKKVLQGIAEVKEGLDSASACRSTCRAGPGSIRAAIRRS